MFVLFALLVIVVIVLLKFKGAVNSSRERLAFYEKKVKSCDTTYGKLTYIDEGEGEVILSCHGICGGYDQAYDTLADKTKNYRILAPSRFGYMGSDMPENATITDQVEAFVELLDYLNIDKAYVLATSAGGTAAIRFALTHPERTKGLILYCSGYPAMEEAAKKSTYAGPPEFLCQDFMMWFFSPLFGPLMGMDSKTVLTIMPLMERREGIVFDAKVTNTDMINNYTEYDMSKLIVPVLMLHSKDDKMADYKIAEQWSNRIPDCTFLSFETGGHLMEGNSEQINAAFEKFTSR